MQSAQELLDALGHSSPYPDLRDDSETIYGSWFTYCDHNILSYSGILKSINNLVLTNNSYKKNVAYDLLKKISKGIYESNPHLQDNYKTVPAIDIKEVVDRICGEYQNPRNLDKVGMAQQEVDKAKTIMQKNVEGMIKNIQDAEVWIVSINI